MTELNFEINHTPGTQEAIDMLRSIAQDGSYTIYGTDQEGKVLPVLNISKHPDCPDGWYDSILRKILNSIAI